MENVSVIAILSFVIVVLFLLFSTFLLTVKTVKKISNKLLASFLIITAIDISIFFYTFFIKLPLSLEMFRIQISHFKDPLLFLYILSVIYTDFKLKTKHLVHVLPWLICIAILTPNFFLATHEEQFKFLSHFWQTIENTLIETISYILEIVYIIAEIYYVLRYRKLLLENYTNREAFSNYKWLKQLIIFILIGQFLTFTKGLSRDLYPTELTDSLRILLLLFGLVFSLWLVLKALHSPKLFRGIAANMKLSKEMIADEKMNNSDDSKQIERLKIYMKTKEPFLESSLTVQILSDKIGIPTRELSVLINQKLGQHFFDFINKYRIKKAMSILKDTSKNKLTILEILYEVGFNSKSSFNTAFKKHTGTTPTAFRKAQ